MAEEQEVRVRELLEELSGVEALVENAGWKQLMLIAQQQLQLRLPGVLRKLDSMDDIPGQEFEKGVVAGIELFCALPGVRVEALKVDIAQLDEEIEDAGGETRIEGGDDGSGSAGDDGEFEGPAPT